MAECQGYREKFSEYIDGVLPAPERRALEEHLAECPACRGELAAWRRLVADVGGLPGPGAPAGFTERVLDRLAQAPSAAPRRAVSLFWHRVLPVAAMILIVLGLTFAVNRPAGVAPPSEGRLAMARSEPRPQAAPAMRAAHRPEEAVSAIMDGDVPLKYDGTRMLDSLYAAAAQPADESEAFALKDSSLSVRAAEVGDDKARPAPPEAEAPVPGTADGRQDAHAKVLADGGSEGPRAAQEVAAPAGPAGALAGGVQVQVFDQVTLAGAPQFRPAAQQVLTLIAEDQAALASRVVGIANSNGLQPALALGNVYGKGAMELHLSVPVERYVSVLHQLSDLTVPQRQTLANTEAGQGPLFAGVLRDYTAYRDRQAGKAGKGPPSRDVRLASAAGSAEEARATAKEELSPAGPPPSSPVMMEAERVDLAPPAPAASVEASYASGEREATAVLGARATTATGEGAGRARRMAPAPSGTAPVEVSLVVRVVVPDAAQ